jgi:hypothetical protein
MENCVLKGVVWVHNEDSFGVKNKCCTCCKSMTLCIHLSYLQSKVKSQIKILHMFVFPWRGSLFLCSFIFGLQNLSYCIERKPQCSETTYLRY